MAISVTGVFMSLFTISAREDFGGDLIEGDRLISQLEEHFGPTARKILAGRYRKPVLVQMVIYPIIDDVDGDGNQLINWMAEIKQDTFEKNDWNQPGKLADFFSIYQDWHFDWLDVAELIRTADQILEYPMVDKDPIDRVSF